MPTNNTSNHVPDRRPAGSPAARAYGATDPDGRMATYKALKLRNVAQTAVTKAKAQGKGDPVAVYDARGTLLGFVSESDLKPLAAAPPVQKSLRAQLRAASAAKRQPDAAQLLKALAALHLRDRVRKSGQKLGDYDLLTTGAMVRSKLSPADRRRFDSLLAKTSADSRRRLDRQLGQAKARLGMRG